MNQTDPPAPRDFFPPPFHLGSWLVQADLNRVSGPDGDHRVEPRVMRVLLSLARTPGEVWTRQALLDEVWGDAVVGEEILTRAISELRRIFGDRAREPQYIETIRHHGYRLIMTPESVAAPAPAAEPRPEPAPPPGPAAEVETGPVPPRSIPSPPSSSRGRFVLWPLLAVVLIGLGLVLGPRLLPGGDQGTSLPPFVTEAIPLTSYPGREWHPSLSPDGTRVAFVWRGMEGEEAPGLYVKQRNSETPLRLTPDEGWVAWPVWSPDGQTLAFVQGQGEGLGEEGAICLVPSLGGAIQILQPVDSWVEGLDFAPDGRSLIYSARQGAEDRYTLMRLDLTSLAVEPRFSPDERRVGDFQPRFSPDGARLVWIGVGPGGQDRIFVASWPEGRPEMLGGELGSLQGLDFTADGQSLICSASLTGSLRLWQLPLAGGGGPRAIATTGAFAWNPRVAREGGQLVYEEVDTDQDIWRVRILGEDPWRLETSAFLRSTRWEQEARIGPDGETVVFISTRSGSPQLWLTQGDGAATRRLTSLQTAGLSCPRFSPDGQAVAFNALVKGRSVIMVLSLRGGAPRTLTPDGESELLGGWSADGASLLYSSEDEGGWSVGRRHLNTGQTSPVMDFSGVTAVETRDGRNLYFTRSDHRGLWSLPLSEDGRAPVGVPPRPVLPELPAGHRHNWVIADNQLHWLMPAAGTTLLMRTALPDGPTRMIGELPSASGDALAVSPDGRTILYPRTGPLEGDLMLMAGSD